MPQPCSDVQRRFEKVAPGSQLEISIDGPVGSCALVWQVVGPDLEVSDPPLSCPGSTQAGPLNTAASLYFVIYRLQFIVDAEVTLGLSVIKPGGTTHSTPVKCTMQGNAGEGATSLWAIFTA